jgi:hypothetical protein
MEIELPYPQSTQPFDGWYTRAGVRGGARRLFSQEQEEGRVFFPPELISYFSHEVVRGLPAPRLRELTIRHLYHVLLATMHAEIRLVNRAAELIANNQAGLCLSRADRLDAYKVYCDEGYHALYCLDLVDQIAAATGIPVPPWDYGDFIEQLDEAGHRFLPGAPTLARLLQVVIFETQVTTLLNEIPNNPTIITPIGDVFRDHARDEGLHHRFFSAFFHALWASLGPSLQVQVANAMPPLIIACSSWGMEPVRSSLMVAGLDGPTTDAVIREVYEGDAAARRLRELTRATVKLCESAGVLEVAGARENFAAHGLS